MSTLCCDSAPSEETWGHSFHQSFILAHSTRVFSVFQLLHVPKKVKWDSPCFLGTCRALPSSYSGTQINRGQQGKGSTNDKVLNAFSASEKSISHRHTAPEAANPPVRATQFLCPQQGSPVKGSIVCREQGMLQGLGQAGLNCSNLSLYLPLLLSSTAWRRLILSKTRWGISSKDCIKAKTHFKGGMSI